MNPALHVSPPLTWAERLFGHRCSLCGRWMGRDPHRDHARCVELFCTHGVILGTGCQTPRYLRSNCQCIHCKPVVFSYYIHGTHSRTNRCV